MLKKIENHRDEKWTIKGSQACAFISLQRRPLPLGRCCSSRPLEYAIITGSLPVLFQKMKISFEVQERGWHSPTSEGGHRREDEDTSKQADLRLSR